MFQIIVSQQNYQNELDIDAICGHIYWDIQNDMIEKANECLSDWVKWLKPKSKRLDLHILLYLWSHTATHLRDIYLIIHLNIKIVNHNISI